MSVKIKGKNRNLVFDFELASFEDHLQFLSEKFKQTPQLFTGSPILFKGEGLDRLTQEEIVRLQLLCLENGMLLDNLDHAASKKSSEPVYNNKPDFQENLFIHKNLRSGQKINARGTVVIWGDVHESAEIAAGKDIIVLGKLEGIAHAGCFGEMNSIVFALKLDPRQIRIGNRVSRASGEEEKRDYPEIAYWDDDSICIKAYNPRAFFNAL